MIKLIQSFQIRWISTHKKKKIIILSGIVSLVFYLLAHFMIPLSITTISGPMYEASFLMRNSLSIIKETLENQNFYLDGNIDPNQTGLIGPRQAELTTSNGHLQAKRTTTNPQLAALIVRLLQQIGVKPGNSVAIGCSASFPALMIASITACQALDLNPIAIISLGASQYGATRLKYNVLHIYQTLLKNGIFRKPAIGISLGGDEDAGREFNSKVREQLLRQIKESGIPFIFEAELELNVKRRMIIYKKHSAGGHISAFINCGGSYANLGTSPLVLRLKPGIIIDPFIPDEKKRGVLFQMVSEGIPSIHLLFIRGLTQKFNLPWDPIPFPLIEKNNATDNKQSKPILLWILTFFYCGSLAIIFIKKRA